MKKLLLSVLVLSGGAVFAQSWVQQNTGFFAQSRGIGQIEIVDANTVWALAYDGSGAGENIQEFTRTSDGGATWTPGEIQIFDPEQEINNISAINYDVAFVSTVHPEQAHGAVYKTENGGIDWMNSNPLGYGFDASFLNWVHFFDENIGVSVGDPVGDIFGGAFEIWRTTDQGATWNPITTSTPPALNEWGYNGGNVGAGDRFWMVTNQGNLYRTDDQGVSWTKYDTPLTDFGSATVNGSTIFSDNNTGLILATTNGGTSYVIYRTFDGGATWSAASPFTGGYNRILTYIPGTTTIVATGAQVTPPAVPGSAYSTDNGATWITIDTGEQRGAVAFLDGSTGWTAGFNESETVGGIFTFSGSLGIGDVVSNGTLRAYPNPTNGIMQISNENAAITEVAVFDFLGKQVQTQKFSAMNNVEVNISSLSTGAYILRVADNTGAMQTLQIMKN